MEAMSLTVERIAEAIGATVDGDGATVIRGVASIETAEPGELTFAVDERRIGLLADSKAAAVLVASATDVPDGLAALRVDDPEAAMAAVLALLAPPEDTPVAGIHPTAVIDATATLGANVAIGPHVAIGKDVTLGDRVALAANVSVGAGSVIGDDTILFPGVVVRHGCRIGRRCRIHPNAVIGADGFGYYHRGGVHHKVPHIGVVRIGDDVEIGACACVDRAKFGATVIGDGAKIDNLVQIAHNVTVGQGVLAAALVGIAGSTKIGNYVVLGGHTGVRDNISIGDGAQVAAYAAVARDVEPGAAMSGIPAIPLRTHRRAMILYPRLPELSRQIHQLQARLDALENETDNTGSDR